VERWIGLVGVGEWVLSECRDDFGDRYDCLAKLLDLLGHEPIGVALANGIGKRAG